MERVALPEKTKVLVIDDDRPLCNVVAEALLAEDIEVLQAHDGAEGLSLARRERPDLIILDVMMPVMSGYEPCRYLRRSFLTANIPVIMLTALGDPMEKVKGMAEGADDYLTKPFHPHELRSRLIAHLRRSERDIQTSPLARLPDNLAVERALRERIARQKPFAVCYIDVDNFKPYNDKYGFFAGDQVLRMLTEIIVDAVLSEGRRRTSSATRGETILWSSPLPNEWRVSVRRLSRGSMLPCPKPMMKRIESALTSSVATGRGG